MRRLILLIFFCSLSLFVAAEQSELKQTLRLLQLLGREAQVLDEYAHYVHMSLTDSATLEVYFYTPDSVLVITTVCAPQCSSCARVYNKEGQKLFIVEPPFSSIFPLATIDKETGKIIWRDNDNWEY